MAFTPVTLRPQKGLLTLWRLYTAGAALSALVIFCPFSLSISLSADQFSWQALPAVAVSVVRLSPTPLRLLVGGLWLLALAGLAAFYWPALFRRQSYLLGQNAAEASGGLLLRYHRVLPWNGVQYLSVASGPLHRCLGISSLVLVAAGGRMVISGLKTTECIELLSQLPAHIAPKEDDTTA